MTDLILTNPLIMTLLAFGCGLFAACISWLAYRLSKGMRQTVCILPSVVCAALMAVNGSVGTGIAILGVFGLVRFRSLPGKSTDLVCVFYAMTAGLLASTGAVWATVTITLLLGIAILAASRLFGKTPQEMEVHVIVPETMKDEKVFRDILARFGSRVRLERMKTAGMGTLYELIYCFLPDKNINQTDLMDELRAANGNLSVSLSESREEQNLY